ncbi:efflux RND transporter periplasmic adaptor subunit [bacterium]|nr:efflux RND transporter periplasmic adaptor subunit [bacterium]
MLAAKSPAARRWGEPWGTVSIIGVVVLAAILLSVGAGSGASDSRDYGIVERGDFTISFIETGDVEAVSKQHIAAPMMWSSKLQVVELVPEGAVVSEGDTLIRFDVTELQTSRDLAADNLSTLMADLNKLDAQNGLTIQNMENQLTLTQYNYKQSVLQLEMKRFESEAVKEEYRLRVKQAELDLNQVAKQLESQKIINHSQRLKLQLSIKQARYRLKSMDEQIGRLLLTAPADGMVVYENLGDERLKEGYEAQPGRSLMSIPDLSKMQVKCAINETDRQKISLDQPVRISLEAYPDAVFDGHIESVSMLAQTVQNKDNLKGFIVYARIHLEEPDPRLKPGMTAIVTILERKLGDVFHCPAGAVFEKEGAPVVSPFGSSRLIPVEVAGRSDGRIVIAGNLAPGMKLAFVPPSDDVHALGYAEELKRVEALRERILTSFDEFRERGILYDYLGGGTQPSEEGGNTQHPRQEAGESPPPGLMMQVPPPPDTNRRR